MLLLYTFLLLLLGVAKFLIGRRLASLERKYSRLALQADRLVRSPQFKEASGGRPDPYQIAKRQYQLGVLAQKRDRVEEKHDAWQVFADRFNRLVTRVRGWKGRALPYTFGVVDVMLLLALADYLAFGEFVTGRYLVDLFQSLVANG
jgi:hypothetical protein